MVIKSLIILIKFRLILNVYAFKKKNDNYFYYKQINY